MPRSGSRPFRPSTIASSRMPWSSTNGSAFRRQRSAADTLDEVERLASHPAFTLQNPNRLRALVGSFGMNHWVFNDASGRGYRFLADMIIAADKLNPQTAARLVPPLGRWRRYGAEAFGARCAASWSGSPTRAGCHATSTNRRPSRWLREPARLPIQFATWQRHRIGGAVERGADALRIDPSVGAVASKRRVSTRVPPAVESAPSKTDDRLPGRRIVAEALKLARTRSGPDRGRSCRDRERRGWCVRRIVSDNEVREQPVGRVDPLRVRHILDVGRRDADRDSRASGAPLR